MPLFHTVHRHRNLQQEAGHTLEREREQRPRVTENVLNVLVPVPPDSSDPYEPGCAVAWTSARRACCCLKSGRDVETGTGRSNN